MRRRKAPRLAVKDSTWRVHGNTIRVVSSSYLRLWIFVPDILIHSEGRPSEGLPQAPRTTEDEGQESSKDVGDGVVGSGGQT